MFASTKHSVHFIRTLWLFFVALHPFDVFQLIYSPPGKLRLLYKIGFLFCGNYPFTLHTISSDFDALQIKTHARIQMPNKKWIWNGQLCRSWYFRSHWIAYHITRFHCTLDANYANYQQLMPLLLRRISLQPNELNNVKVTFYMNRLLSIKSFYFLQCSFITSNELAFNLMNRVDGITLQCQLMIINVWDNQFERVLNNFLQELHNLLNAFVI